MKIYMAVTADVYELPVAIFRSRKEVATWLGVSAKYVSSIIAKNAEVKKKHVRIVKVKVLEKDDEKMQKSYKTKKLHRV